MSTAGNPLGEGRGGGDAPKPDTNEERFDCTGDGCVVADRASEMYNTSCDPNAIALDELRTKVLCVSCAVRYARKRGKHVAVSAVDDDGIPRFSKRDITAAGSGLYPLAQTLRAMRTRAALAVGGAEHDGPYACMESGCTTSGPAGEMFNRPCDMASTGMRELLQLVCCRRHAESVAAKRGMRPGESGSGVYLLNATLRRIQARGGSATPSGPTPRERHEQSYLEWYLQRPIARYAAQLAAATGPNDGSDFLSPSPNVAADGTHCCGLPLECCGHDLTVDRYVAFAGEVVGVCAVAAQAFSIASDGMDPGDDRRHRIAPIESAEHAALAASHWLGTHENAPVPDCPACARTKKQ